MRHLTGWSLLVVLLALSIAPLVHAQDAPPAPVGADPAAQDADIAGLIKDLDANRFSTRQDACRKLKELGKNAIPALTQAALGTSREASGRAIELLKEHFAAEEGDLKEAARAALQKLADSDKQPIARLAKDALTPAQVEPAQPMLQLGQGQIQLQFQVGGNQQVQVKTANGVTDTEATENGRSVRIHEDPKKGITVDVTEKKDGQDVSRKYEAKDVAELKRKHPEAHKLYEKYSQGGGIQIQAIQFPALQMQQVRAGLPLPVPPGMIDPKELSDKLEKVSDQLDETRKLLDQLKAQSRESEPLQKAIDQLEKARKELEETRDKLK